MFKVKKKTITIFLRNIPLSRCDPYKLGQKGVVQIIIKKIKLLLLLSELQYSEEMRRLLYCCDTVGPKWTNPIKQINVFIRQAWKTFNTFFCKDLLFFSFFVVIFCYSNCPHGSRWGDLVPEIRRESTRHRWSFLPPWWLWCHHRCHQAAVSSLDVENSVDIQFEDIFAVWWWHIVIFFLAD